MASKIATIGERYWTSGPVVAGSEELRVRWAPSGARRLGQRALRAAVAAGDVVTVATNALEGVAFGGVVSYTAELGDEDDDF